MSGQGKRNPASQKPAADLSDAGRSDLIRSFLENQSKELSLRSEELVLRKQEGSNSFDYSKEALGAKIEDRKDQRQHQKSLRKMTLIFSGAVIFLLVGIVVTSLVMGEDEIAKEIIKAVIYVSGGAFGGWGYAASRKQKSPESQD